MRPWSTFEDSFRPAGLLLQVYRLLECETGPLTAGETVERLRVALNHPADEELLVLLNDLFTGIVRERAGVPRSDLRLQNLSNLLRQSVVAACSAMDAYLPLLLRTHLPTVIRVRGRDFVPSDRETRGFFEDFRLDLAGMVRLMTDAEPEQFLGALILSHIRIKTFGNRSGVHIAGALLGLDNPWDQIAERLDQKKADLQARIEAIVKRRNNIVHRADRSELDPDGPPEDIHLSWTFSHVNAVRDVVKALDELVEHRMREYEALAPADGQAAVSAALATGEP
jgi:hypothetical protein